MGKSTLLNAILGEKVAIVSNKPQTTRNRITGIYTKGDDQFVFLDTPGMHSPKNSLGEFMVKTADTSMRDADAVVLVVDTGKDITTVEDTPASSFAGTHTQEISYRSSSRNSLAFTPSSSVTIACSFTS